MVLRRALLAVLLLAAGAAHAVEALPIIVTYEMQRQREAVRDFRKDPRAFWIRQVAARIEDRKSAAPLGLRQPVTVRISFVVGRDGRLASKAVETSSGVQAVDGAALAVLDRAQPFPPMPPAMPDDGVSFTLPLRFR